MRHAKVKWGGLNNRHNDLHVVIRGAHWDVVQNHDGTWWSIIAPEPLGRHVEVHKTRREAQYAAELMMQKLGVI